jgi:nitroimidazol reductase NimA-like FMN-containing flavoprotein (pyridoxamine 5'-phosphate oxidase superfamily)
VKENKLSATSRTKHHRLREQGSEDRADLTAVLEAGFVAHLGLIVDGAPMVVPTSYGFDETNLFLHGSVASRSLQDNPDSLICVTITLVDGLVLARSVFEHGMNYRSAMIYGRPRLVSDSEEKLYGLRCLSEHIVPGQWDYVRQPSRKELAATTLLAVSLAEASVKIRTGPPSDADSPDAELGLWAGELPLIQTWGDPKPDPQLPADLKPPTHIVVRGGQPAFGA